MSTPSAILVHRFGEFDLDLSSGRLFRGSSRVPLSDQQSGVLASLVARAGRVVSKEMLAEAGWQTTAVTDAAVAQTVFRLRKVLRSPDGVAFIETVPGHGYRFASPVARAERDEAHPQQTTDLLPYRAFIEGRAALHTL